ncbi:MAG: Asp-tRNA(Asn)/Glu-tRNA(Gln) amidotransferase subunit GatC, partial [Phycisphaerae bacterium]
MAKLTNEQVRHVAKLARLSLTDDEVDLFATQLGDILEYVKKLDEVDTARVTPLSHPHEQTNVLREDEPT